MRGVARSAAAAAALAALLAACGPARPPIRSLYPGPQRAAREVALIEYAGGPALVVAVDGRRLDPPAGGAAGFRLTVEPGPHTLTVVREGGAPAGSTPPPEGGERLDFVAHPGSRYQLTAWPPHLDETRF